MENLILIHKDAAVVSSLDVAESFHKRHSDVIEKIEKIIRDDSTENSVKCFSLGFYSDDSGKRNKMYYMNRDGFSFLAMGFTGKKAMEWKWKYIEAFNKMESYIKETIANRISQKKQWMF